MPDTTPSAPPMIEVFVWLRGRLRRRYTLADAAGEELGTYEIDYRRGAFRAADGRDWEYRTDGASAHADGPAGERIAVVCDSEGDDRLTVDGQVFGYRLDRLAGQSARLTDPSGAVVLDARNPGWHAGPFRAVAVASGVPQAAGVSALGGFLLVFTYEDLRWSASQSGGGAGGGGS